MQSLIGRPDLDEQLDLEIDADPACTNSAYLNLFTAVRYVGDDENENFYDEEDIRDAEMASPVSDESEWGTINGCFDVNAFFNDDQYSVSDEDVKPLYTPDPVLTLNDTKKPLLPQLPIAKIPVGCRVWVVDEEDVELLLHDHWEDMYRTVCNGRLCGTVVRHSETLTLVAFHDDCLDIHYALSLPRACLSITPIDSYEHSPKMSKFISSSLGICNLNPRPGLDCRAARQQPYRQFYESLSGLEVQMPPKSALPQERILSGDFEGALTIIDELLSTVEVGNAPYRVDLLTLRSQACVFLGLYDDALRNALEVIELQPCWVKGYLCAARALSCTGDYAAANAQIRRVSLLLPHSQALKKVEDLNTFLANLQNELTRNTLKIHMDFRYAKYLIALRAFGKHEVVCSEERAILVMPSILAEPEELAGYCSVCFKAAIDMIRTPVDFLSKDVYTNDTTETSFCSLECQQRSALFLPMEQGRHRIAVERARDLIRTKFASNLQQTSLDLAYMTTRLFLIVCATHDRLLSERRQQEMSRSSGGDSTTMSFEKSTHSASSDCIEPVTLQTVMQELGVYPLPTLQITCSVQKEMSVVYDTLTSFFEEEERQMYSLSFFLAIYEYVLNFAVCAKLPVRESAPVRFPFVFYLPKIVGAVRRVDPSIANCTFAIEEGTTRIKLLATRDISEGEAISIPCWSAPSCWDTS